MGKDLALGMQTNGFFTKAKEMGEGKEGQDLPE